MFLIDTLRIALLSSLLPLFLFCAAIETFYGVMEVEEPVLLELIESPAFQRLRHVRQYGVSYYTTHREEYTRYAHSLGVFAVLRSQGASLKEQIAGLLHDVSHTVFSHVGDWLFEVENQSDDYQSRVHKSFLEHYGLGEILERHGFTIDEVLPLGELFPALEQSLPNLCADRIDYNIQGAYHRGSITQEEALQLFEDLQFVDGLWVVTQKELWARVVRYSLMMSQECWGGPTNFLSSRWLADAMKRGLELGLLSLEEIHFGTDQKVWDKLMESEDGFIQERLQRVLHVTELYQLTDPVHADMVVVSKCRGFNPLVVEGDHLVRLLSTDPELEAEYARVRAKSASGWPLHLLLEGGGVDVSDRI